MKADRDVQWLTKGNADRSPNRLLDETFNAIVDFIEEHGYPPSVRQLGKVLGLTSPDSVSKRLKAVEREGLITIAPGVARGIIVKDQP